MAVRLRPIDIFGLGISAPDNPGCLVLDSVTGFLFKSDGTSWEPYAGPALGLLAENTGPIPPGSLSGALLFDQTIGFVLSDGTGWRVPARDLDHELGLITASHGLDDTQLWPAPRLVGATPATVAPAIGDLFLCPFTVPSIGSSIQLKKLHYKVTTFDLAGTAFVGVYRAGTSANQFPDALQAGENTVESANGWYTAALSPTPAYARGVRVWLAYLRTAGAATLLSQSGPGDLGYAIGGGGSIDATDFVYPSGAPFASLPLTLAPTHWTRFGAASAPQFLVEFGP